MRKIPLLGLPVGLLLVAVLIAVALPIPMVIADTTPILCWGDVDFDSGPAPVGTTVEIFVGADTTASGSGTVVTAGQYGSIPVWADNSRYGEALTYKVNGYVASKLGPDAGVFGIQNQVVNLAGISGSPPPDGGGGLSGGAVAGITVGALVAVALIAWLILRRKRGSGTASETPGPV